MNKRLFLLISLVICVIFTHAQGVRINELMSSNSTVIADNTGEFDDWIELYNTSSNDQDISGFFLSDNPSNLDKWEIPAGTIITGNGYLIFWADEDSSQGPNHCNFKLSGSGEQLMLFDGGLSLVDSVVFGIIPTDIGYARYPNGTGSFIRQAPTFNASNGGTGIRDFDYYNYLPIMPNPSNGLIKFPFIVNQLKIQKISGETVFIYSGPPTETIDLRDELPSGLYLISTDLHTNTKLFISN